MSRACTPSRPCTASRAAFGVGALALCGLLAGALGCSDAAGELTQIQVTVDSDLDVPGELDRVSIAVSGMVTDAPALADLSKAPLPRHLTLLHKGGPLGPVTVTATGLHGRTDVIERAVQLSFVAGKTVPLAIQLQRACLDVSCKPGASCEDGECVSIADGSPVGNDDGGSDAGEQDAGGLDAGELDAGDLDAGQLDAGPDAGDAGSTDAGGQDAGQDASAQDAGDSGSAVNEPPICTITTPVEDAALVAGQSEHFSGRCTDPESGRRLSFGLRWSSDRDGALGNGSMIDVSLDARGEHVISLCATDPVDSSLEGCGSASVTLSLPPAPTASIDSVQQMDSSAQPFGVGPDVVLMASASGQNATLAWRDTFVGGFGDTEQVSLASPQVGRHRVTFTVTDNVGQSAEASAVFVVVPDGSAQLVQPFGTTNTVTGAAGGARIDALGADSLDNALLANPLPAIYRVDGTTPTATPSLSITAPTVAGAVRALAISEADGKVYFATSGGLTVCTYAASTGIDGGACSTFKNGQFPDNDTQAVLRTKRGPMQYLLVGTKGGLFRSMSILGSSNGQQALEDSEIAAIADDGSEVWLATRGDGLWAYNPMNNQTHTHGGEPSDELSSVSVDQLGMVWVGSDNGLGRYDPEDDSWLMLRTDQSPEPGLPSDTIRCLATTRVLLDGDSHDIVWVGSDAGVTRIDTTFGTLMNLTVADGLPSANVRSLVVLTDGSKLIGTDLGLARYTGP